MQRTFSVSITSELKRIGKNEEIKTKTISYKLQFVDIARFIASSLYNLVGNLAEEIHKIKGKYGHDKKKREKCEIKYKDCEGCLE